MELIKFNFKDRALVELTNGAEKALAALKLMGVAIPKIRESKQILNDKDYWTSLESKDRSIFKGTRNKTLLTYESARVAYEWGVHWGYTACQKLRPWTYESASKIINAMTSDPDSERAKHIAINNLLIAAELCEIFFLQRPGVHILPWSLQTDVTYGESEKVFRFVYNCAAEWASSVKETGAIWGQSAGYVEENWLTWIDCCCADFRAPEKRGGLFSNEPELRRNNEIELHSQIPSLQLAIERLSQAREPMHSRYGELNERQFNRRKEELRGDTFRLQELQTDQDNRRAEFASQLLNHYAHAEALNVDARQKAERALRAAIRLFESDTPHLYPPSEPVASFQVDKLRSSMALSIEEKARMNNIIFGFAVVKHAACATKSAEDVHSDFSDEVELSMSALRKWYEGKILLQPKL